MEFVFIENFEDVKNHISKFCLDKNVFKELGEPIFHTDNSKYIICCIDNICIGFLSYELKKEICNLKYCYIYKEYRNKGIFKKLHIIFVDKLPNYIKYINVISSVFALPIYLKFGYIEIKKYKICSHLKLKL